MAKIGGLNLRVYVRGVAKADIESINVGQQETDKTSQYHQKTPWGGLSQAPLMNVVQTFPVTVENVSHQKNFKNPVPTEKQNKTKQNKKKKKAQHTGLNGKIDLQTKFILMVGDTV